jgi:hypothetical protein
MWVVVALIAGAAAYIGYRVRPTVWGAVIGAAVGGIVADAATHHFWRG